MALASNPRMILHSMTGFPVSRIGMETVVAEMIVLSLIIHHELGTWL